ncbi:LETM1-related biofilm-associated protein [Aureisphaera galaxeae]|uniref:LETM1-related biofilm-associated protein n=1 Tax=Aureisphaera galaxeae TaxID=1538023 RepID=UPI00234FCF3B|nr:LETM1-related biofilm-associated protein [Aureisphaera galaxeae]MDC8003563.1 LETM1-related biofilm-associated protein [Aureisphaera galaxeae]
MNPSSSGWIHKFINEFPKNRLLDNFTSPSVFYDGLKKAGFIYGVSVSTLLDEPVSHLKLTKEEYSKINLFHALLHTYFSKHPTANHEAAIESIISFYKEIERGKQKWLQRLSFSQKPSEDLEKILSARLQESNTLLKTDAASLLTYALLYVDVLGYTYYLEQPEGLKAYLEALEYTILEYSLLALQSKEEKNKYDQLVIDMVASSAQFLEGFPADAPKPSTTLKVLEKRFLLDICCLAVWDDREMDTSELAFLKKLSTTLGHTQSQLDACIRSLTAFSVQNAEKIILFEYTHPVKQLYKQSTETVKRLILRNKNRLLKELNESGELLVLISQSTQRDLTKEEKTKMKGQLLDIFKSIPSLAIFMLPGGAILLPLFVKLIPKLLPSAFHENRVEED